MMVRVPLADRDFTTTIDPAVGLQQTFNSKSVGDIEVVGMYAGFFEDMSTGVTFGLKLPTGTYTAYGLDRDTQIGSGSTDLLLGGFHRGLITGDNHWQYFAQARWQVPFLYSAAYDSDLGTYALYKPGYQVDGALGMIYNNLYNVFGFDKITPLAQIIASHRVHDNGPASDPLNTGLDRLMFSPGIEFTKVVDEANNRVLKFYADVEIPFYYRTNAADNGGLPSVGGTEGQLVAPIAGQGSRELQLLRMGGIAMRFAHRLPVACVATKQNQLSAKSRCPPRPTWVLDRGPSDRIAGFQS